MIANPWFLVGVLVAVIGAGAGGFKLGADHEVASQARNDEQIAKVVEEVKTANATTIAALKPTYTTIKSEVQREIRENVVYADCKHTPDGLRLINAAIDGAYRPADTGKLHEANAPAK